MKRVALSQPPQRVTAAKSHWETPENGSNVDLGIISPKGSRTRVFLHPRNYLRAESFPRTHSTCCASRQGSLLPFYKHPQAQTGRCWHLFVGRGTLTQQRPGSAPP